MVAVDCSANRQRAFALLEDPFDPLQRAGDVDRDVSAIGLERAKHPDQGPRRFRQKQPDTISARATGCLQGSGQAIARFFEGSIGWSAALEDHGYRFGTPLGLAGQPILQTVSHKAVPREAASKTRRCALTLPRPGGCRG